jgi:hypothetical protein
MHICKINILIFTFDVCYVFLTRGFVFRKTVVYAVGMVCFTYIGISSLVGRRVSSTSLLIPMHVKHTIPIAYTTVFLKMNPQVRNM